MDVSTLIADDLRERTCELEVIDSSEDVEGAGEGGENGFTGAIDEKRRF